MHPPPGEWSAPHRTYTPPNRVQTSLVRTRAAVQFMAGLICVLSLCGWAALLALLLRGSDLSFLPW